MRNVIDLLIVATFLLVLFLVSTNTSRAADYIFRGGPGIGDSGMTGQTKAFGVRREDAIMDGLRWSAELGAIIDNRPGGKHSVMARAQLGVAPGPETGVFGYAYIGPAAISSPDARLGSIYQIATDLGFGIRDRDSLMAVGYQHLSNAGLKAPNSGKDHILFSLGFHFN